MRHRPRRIGPPRLPSRCTHICNRKKQISPRQFWELFPNSATIQTPPSNLADSISAKHIKTWTGLSKLHQTSHRNQLPITKASTMCHGHRQRYYASPTCYLKWGYRRPHGWHHRRCTEIAMTQSAPITRVSSAEVMDINTVPPVSREIVAEIPIDEDKVGVDPPPYSEHEGSGVPETGRGYAQHGNLKPVPLEKLEKEPGYVVVFPPLRICADEKCPLCRIEGHTNTRNVTSSPFFVPAAALCYATGVLAPLPPLYLSKYGEKAHRCGSCGYAIAKHNPKQGTTMVITTGDGLSRPSTR